MNHGRMVWEDPFSLTLKLRTPDRHRGLRNLPVIERWVLLQDSGGQKGELLQM